MPKNREVANVPLLPPDAHGDCPQSRGSGDAIVPEWARRNLVTLVIVYYMKAYQSSFRRRCFCHSFKKSSSKVAVLHCPRRRSQGTTQYSVSGRHFGNRSSASHYGLGKQKIIN